MFSNMSAEGYSGYSVSPDEIYEDKIQIYSGSESCPIYTTQHSMPKNDEKTIKTDLVKLNLPNNIVISADKIYKDMISKGQVGTKRGKRRKMLIFFCVYTAYNQVKITVDPANLANICGIEKSSISKALSMCSSIHTGFDSVSQLVRRLPKHFIPVHFEKLKELIDFPEGALDDLFTMTEEIVEKAPELKDQKPQTVAAAICVYYLSNRGITIDKSKYRSIFEMSDMTINKIKKKVIKAHNS